jgi:hypothetical protein
MYNILSTESTHLVFSERKSHDITTTKTQLSSSDWHNYCMLTCWCVPGCLEAFFEVNSIKQDNKA